MGIFGKIGRSIMGLGNAIGGVADDTESAKKQRADITAQGDASSAFAGQGEANYGAMTAEAAGARDQLRRQASGELSLTAEQLRQGLQQQRAAMQSAAAGAPPGSAPMMARTAVLGGARASSAMAGQAALAGLAERQAAAKAWQDAILQQRAQDIQVGLGGRQNAVNAYGGVTPEKSWLDKWGGAITAGAGLLATSPKKENQ